MRHKNSALYRALVGVSNTDEQRNNNNARGAGRRALALLLAFMLCVSFVPMGALASGAPKDLADEFTLTNGATLVDGEYYAYAGDINFNWEISGGVDLNKEPKGSVLLICFADGANSDAAIEEIAIKDGMTGKTNIPTGYYGMGYFYGLSYWNDVGVGSVDAELDNSKQAGYKGVSGTITVNTPGRYEFYPKTYHATMSGGWNLTDTPTDSGFYGGVNNRYGADAEPIVLNVLSSGSVPVTCKNGTLSNVYGLEGSEPPLCTSSNSFGFSATAEDGSPVTGAYYTYHGSTVISGPCVDVGGYYTVALPEDSGSGTGTGTPYVEITLLTEPVDDTEVTVNSSVSPDATTATVSEFSNLYRPGDYVSFTVEAAENYAVADVYATYTYGTGTDTRSLTVQSAGDGYYFYIPEDFGGAEAPTVTVHVTTASTAKQETSVELELDGGSGAGATYHGGDVLSATATVYDADNNPLTGHAGAMVTFVMPNGEVVNGFLESDGTARATWVVPHDFAESHENGTVQANFAGDGDYAKSDAASETVNFESTAIKPAAGAAITATAEGIGAGTVLTVGQTAVLGLSENAVLVNGASIDTAGYTVEWFMSDGGAWKPMSADYSVTVAPWSTSYAYMAVISGTGEYEGEFSLVVSCDTEAQSAFGTASPVGAEVYEGQGFELSADIYYNGDAANAATGGVVRFYAAAGGTRAYLGEANVVNGVARLSLASASLPAGSYTVSAEYSGVSGVYAPALGSDIGTITILSATLNSGAFSLDNYTLTLGTENTITLSNSGGYIHGTDYTVSWQVSRDGGLT